MTERSGVFSAGATGVPVTTTNIVLDESYQTMNQSALSSPAQNQDHTTTNHMENTVTATAANINTNSTFPRYESDQTMNQSALSSSPAQNQGHNATNNMYNTVSIASLFPPLYDSNLNNSQSSEESIEPEQEFPRLVISSLFPPVSRSQSDGESLQAIGRSGASDSDDYNSLFRKKLNLNVWSGGERLSSNNSNDVWSVGSRDWQRSPSGDSGYFLSQDSGMAAEDDMMWDYGHLLIDNYPEPDISSIMDQFRKSQGLLPDNVTTSNFNPPQPPQIVIEKNHQGEVAREMTNRGLITDLSSCNNIGSVPLDNLTTSNSNPPQPSQIVIEKNHQGEVAKEMTNGGLITDLSSCNNIGSVPPDNLTTSNSNPPQPSQIVIEKNHQGEVAREMTNSGLITDLSSCNNIGFVPPACDDEDEILSPENSGVEVSSESLVNTIEGSREFESHHVPNVRMKFSSEDEALKFYKKYAMEIGFKVRKGKVERLADKSVAKRYFYCSNEGFRSNKKQTSTKKFTRKETRTGCKAMMQIMLKKGEWSVSKFISEHNHDLQGSTQRCYIDSCSKIPEADSLIQPTREIETVKEAEAGACARFSDMSYSKHLHANKSKILQPEDAQGLIDYLKKLQEKDLSLFYTFQVDAECHITNFFWRDSRSKIDYCYFGDVLILDTTFKTDRYDMICAPFLGLNHHRRQVLFGCAFLLDESVESFTWLLRTFMEAMGRRQPKTIFTTECPAISEAVELTLPKSQHLICKQFVCQNAKQHLSTYYGHPEFERDFCFFLFAYQSEGKFQSFWSSLLEKYNLDENPWLQNIYTLRSKWSYLFCKMTFCAGIKSNQWPDCLSNANVFQNAKSEAMMLWEYVLKYEKAAEHQRREELQEDFCCNASKQMLFSSSPMEKQAASVYTPTMFIIFKDELIGSMSLPFKRLGRTGSIVTYKTKGNIESIVEFNSQDSTITCSCKMFESVGILCAHALRVLNIRNIFQIPPQYILKRWTKSAKDGVGEGDYNGEEIADNSESLYKSKFMHKALNVVTKSVAVKRTRKIAERYLDIALKEVDDELKKGNEHHNTKDAEVNHEGVKNTSSVARVDWQEKVAKDLYLNQGETSKGTMEFQIQEKRKNEVREKMNPLSSSMSLP